jgi:hypothetical protein
MLKSDKSPSSLKSALEKTILTPFDAAGCNSDAYRWKRRAVQLVHNVHCAAQGSGKHLSFGVLPAFGDFCPVSLVPSVSGAIIS